MGVMGSNLALNFEDHGHAVSIYDKNSELLTAFHESHGEKTFHCSDSVEDFCQSLATPRCILLMVTAGQAVDWCIDSLLPHLDPGDIIIDGGNSQYMDTRCRNHPLAEQGIHFCGMGVSGGEEGARRGPAMMFGGTEAAWDSVKEVLQSIAARTTPMRS